MSEEVALYSKKTGFIYLFNISSKSITDSFDFPILKLGKFKFFLKDSMLYVMESGNNFIEKYYIPTRRLLGNYKYPDTTNNLYSLLAPFKIDDNGRILFCKVPNYLNMGIKQQAIQYYSMPMLALAHLRDSSVYIIYNFATFPEEYKRHGFNEYYPNYTLINDTTTAYIYSTEDSIHISSPHGNHSQKIIGLEKNKLNPVNDDSLQYMSYTKKYEVINEKYNLLLYDNTIKSFYLFQTHKAPEAKDGEISLWKDKSLTIYLIDSNFEVKGTRTFDKIGDYILPTCFAYNGSMYLGKANKNILSYECYKFNN